jgi:hypothetical protein
MARQLRIGKQMAAKPIKPTKAQLAEAKVRASASGISMNQSAKGLRNASKAIIAGASLLPAGRAVKAATTTAKTISKVRAGGVGRDGAGKLATKVGDRLSGASSKKVQNKLHKIAVKDAPSTAARNKDLDSAGAYAWSKHPAIVSQKGFNKNVNQGKTVTDRQSVRYRNKEDKAATKANTRGLKAANRTRSGKRAK